MIANTFDVNTMNGSRVMPKMAGTLSTANTTSVLSTTSSTMNSEVTNSLPVLPDKKLVAVRSLGHAQIAPGESQHEIMVRMRLDAVGAGQLDARIDQKRAEEVENPFETAPATGWPRG